jgi:hypothetical protein
VTVKFSTRPPDFSRGVGKAVLISPGANLLISWKRAIRPRLSPVAVGL